MKKIILAICAVTMLTETTGYEMPPAPAEVEIVETVAVVENVEPMREVELFKEIPEVEVEEIEEEILEEARSIEEIVETVEIEPVEPPSEALSAHQTNFIYFDIPLDRDLQEHLYAVCEARGVDPALVVAMIQRESNFDIDAIGDQGNSLGLMQIQPRWNQERMAALNCWDLLDPYQNITVGVDIIGELLEDGKGVEWALMAYNGGPAYANRLSGSGSVSTYAKAVLEGRGRYGSGV